MSGIQKDIRYYDDVSTDESGGCSEDGGSETNIKDIRKMSSQSEGSQKEHIEDDFSKKDNLIQSKIQRLKANVTRTNQFLTELKALSESCQEYIPAIEYEVDENGELHKERQVFIRRIVQLGAELQDAKDTVLSICKECMPNRQWRILLDIIGPNCKPEVDDDEDEFIVSMMGSCNLDPSVRFFGIEWERVFGRCFSLSLNVKIFGQQIMNATEDTFRQSSGSSIDLILVNTLMKDFSTLEADVASHGEAVLQGRLSKSQQRLIRREQLKNCAPLSHTANINNNFRRKASGIVRKTSSSKSTNLQKSKSFRRVGPTSLATTGRKQSEPIYKYRKNKTTHLDKLGSDIEQNSTPVVSTLRTSNEVISNANKSDVWSFQNDRSNAQIQTNGFCDRNQNETKHQGGEYYSQEMKVLNNRPNDIDNTVAQHNSLASDESNKHVIPRKKNSIFQNVSSILKNIR